MQNYSNNIQKTNHVIKLYDKFKVDDIVNPMRCRFKVLIYILLF